MKEKYTIFENFKLLSVSQGLTGKMTGMPAITSSMLCNENCQKLMQIKGSVCEKCYTKKYLSSRPSVDAKLSFSVKLLQFTQEPITEVAIQSGFSTITYFNRVFKKCFGISPREYRNKNTPSPRKSQRSSRL